MSHVLIVEDEQHIAEGLRFNLEAEGHEAHIVNNGIRAVDLLLEDRDRFDIVILDVMLPGKDGFEVAATVRAAGQFVPILMLTARGRPEDVLKGFEAGADDYLPKPFELAILIARVGGLLRRGRWWHQRRAPTAVTAPPSDVFTFADRTLDFRGMEVRAKGTSYPLTLMECELLRYLVKNAGKPVSRKAILEQVWNLHEETDTRAIDNFVVRLRRYLEDDPARPKFLLTVRGVGYKFVPEERDSARA
jgi:two-component system, OmpR family, alkaline phosphatase synthesis response regulator PhoP